MSTVLTEKRIKIMFIREKLAYFREKSSKSMFKKIALFFSIIIVIVLFSFCVGTLYSTTQTDNERENNPYTEVAAGEFVQNNVIDQKQPESNTISMDELEDKPEDKSKDKPKDKPEDKSTEEGQAHIQEKEKLYAIGKSLQEAKNAVENKISQTKALLSNNTLVGTIDFVPQSPFATWELPFKEACEEASFIMAQSFFLDENLDKYKMKEKIIDVVKWQEDNLGKSIHTNIDESNRIAQEFYHFKTQIVYNPTIEDLQSYIEKGFVIWVPTAGQELQNPYFKPPGPYYHTVLIIGFNEDNFIVHDPGTKRGAYFEYEKNLLLDAIHDYDENDIFSAQKAVLVLEGLDKPE